MKKLLVVALIIILSLCVLVACNPTEDVNAEFTNDEKALINATVGEDIPYLSAERYTIVKRTSNGGNESLINGDKGDYILYNTTGTAKADFEAYLQKLQEIGYAKVGEEKDTEFSPVVYTYKKGDIMIEIYHYTYDGVEYAEACVWLGGKNAEDETPDTPDTPDVPENPENPDTPDSPDTPDTPDTPVNPPATNRIHTEFTDAQKEIFISLIGEVIPFLPNDGYEVETVTGEDGTYIAFYTDENTEEEFEAYKDALVKSGYTLSDTYVDSYGETCYDYTKGKILVTICWYNLEGVDVVDIFASLTSDSTDTPDTPVNPPATDRVNKDFSAEEKEAYINLLGEVVPFIPNDDYGFEEGNDAEYMGAFIGFWTFDNTEAEFNAYRTAIVKAGYTLDGTEVDDFGDTWYYYSKGDIFFDISYYYNEGAYVVDTYAYINPDTNQGGGTSGGNSGGNSGDNVTIITNKGKGLPSGTNGVYNVDFTTATNVKTVADQGYYLGGCPTMGENINVLVIPVEFGVGEALGKGYTLDKLDKAFNSKDTTDGIYSVYEYFNISSHGKLKLTFTIPSSWYTASQTSSYYENQVDDEGGLLGDQILLDEALQYYAGTMDLSQFDSDGNHIIDAVVIINTLEIGEDDFHWAYRYWNQYADEDGYYYEYDGVSANDYLWASYQFLLEGYDEEGQTYYDDNNFNTYTFIHEFSHILGADDYYDTAYIGAPLDGQDMMDSMFGDHNPYTKFNYGWLTTSRLVVAEDSVTLTLEDFSKNGDTIIIANNWDTALGAYQEYYVLMYYTENGVNAGDEYGFFAREGVVVYHVNASLYKEVIDGETYYDVYNNNTDGSDEYGTEDNLIEFVKSANDTFTYIAGDTMPTTIDDNGNALIYNFVVDSLDGETATITFTKK